MILPTIPIPKNLQDALSDIIKIKGNLVINLGVKYDEAKIIETITPKFTKFKDKIKKSLEEKGLDKEEISKTISLIQNNHEMIYPDNSDSLTDVKEEEYEEGGFTKPDMPFEEWLSKLNEKYYSVKETCDKNFPDIWQAVEFALSVRNILSVKDITLPFAGIILGPPSSSKTLVLEMLRESANMFYTDSFTPKSFVSHNTAVKLEQLQKIDMLPKIKDKLFITPELAPVFSAKEEEFIQTLGIMTRILDGHGYESDTGAYGHRGYNENIMFTWIGAAVDIPRKVYKHLSTLGPKLYFFRMKVGKKSHNEFLRELKENNFSSRKNEVKEALLDYVKWFECCPTGQVESNKLINIEWDSSKDDDNALLSIVHLGELLAPLRGVAITWETRDTQSSDYAYYTPIVEHPSRAMTCLTNVSKGHALLTGRNYLTMDDIPILIKIVLSTAPIERIVIFDELLSAKGELTSFQIINSLNIAKPTALKTMAELKVLGLVDLTKESEAENAMQTIKLKDDFKWFLSEEFQKLREGFVPEGKSKYDDKDAEDSVKKNSPHLEKKILLDNENLDDDASNPQPSLLKTTQDTGEDRNEKTKK